VRVVTSSTDFYRIGYTELETVAEYSSQTGTSNKLAVPTEVSQELLNVPWFLYLGLHLLVLIFQAI